MARQIDASADRELVQLAKELTSYPVPPGAKPYRSGNDAALGGVAVPLQLSTEEAVLSFISTTTVFGTALDIGLSELTIESFFPANDATAEILVVRHGTDALGADPVRAVPGAELRTGHSRAY